MTARDVMAEASRLGIELGVCGDRLQVDAPQGVMTPELRAGLRAH